MGKYIRSVVIMLIILIASGISCYARDIPFDISVEKDYMEVGDVFIIGLGFNDTSQVPAPELPELDGFKSQYMGPSTEMSIINGKVTASVTHRYKMVAVKKGVFSFGPFSFTYNNDKYTSNSKQITVVDRGQAQAQQKQLSLPSGANEADNNEDLSGRIFLKVISPKKEVYLNERVPVAIKLYVGDLTVRGIEKPGVEGQGFAQEELVNPRQYREELNTRVYDIVEFNTYIYATREGEITFGPAKIKCNVLSQSQRKRRGFGMNDFFDNEFFDDSFISDFFGRVQYFPMEIKSEELPFKVLPFPETNKPAEFSGAVGDFKMQVECAPKEVRVGDPVTLTMRLSGKGNFDSVQAPVISDTKGFKIYNAEARQEQEVKIFEQVIIPQENDITQIPQIKFAYFNTEEKKYVTLAEEPIPLKVLPAQQQQGLIIDAQEQKRKPALTQVLGRDIIYIKENIGTLREKGAYLYSRKAFFMLYLAPLFLLGAVFIFQKRRQRLESDVRYARKLRAPKIARVRLKAAKEKLNRNESVAFYDEIFKTLQEYLGHRFNRSSGGITSAVVDELIESEGLEKEIGEKLKMCFGDCDITRYAPASFDEKRMEQIMATLEEVIDYLEKKKSGRVSRLLKPRPDGKR